jgi:ribonuclease-3
MPNNDLVKIQKVIEFQFTDMELLQKALTHKSYAAETGKNGHNERMEFLGDSVLSSSVADFLYHKYPDQDEGRLSQLKSQIVSRQNLARWARELKLGGFIYISKGEDANGGRLRDSLLANTLEALIAAIYLDGGYDAARTFIFGHMTKQKRLIVTDTKSKLQEYIQSQYQTLPDYRVISESGPDHDKVFEIGVYLKKTLLGQGTGCCKKEAEQLAARRALRALRDEKKAKSTDNKK